MSIRRDKVRSNDFKKQTLCMFLIAIGGIAVTAVGSLIALGLNMITANVFSCAAFLATARYFVRIRAKQLIKQLEWLQEKPLPVVLMKCPNAYRIRAYVL